MKFCEVAKVDPDCKHANGRLWSVPETLAHVNTFIAVQCFMRRIYIHPVSLRKTYLQGIKAMSAIMQQKSNFENAIGSADIRLVLQPRA